VSVLGVENHLDSPSDPDHKRVAVFAHGDQDFAARACGDADLVPEAVFRPCCGGQEDDFIAAILGEVPEAALKQHES
jgi:hypothetical protein